MVVGTVVIDVVEGEVVVSDFIPVLSLVSGDVDISIGRVVPILVVVWRKVGVTAVPFCTAVPIRRRSNTWLVFIVIVPGEGLIEGPRFTHKKILKSFSSLVTADT